MNANVIIDETMTLEQKLEAIAQAMQNVQDKAKEEAKKWGREFVPLDPADLTICEGCT